MILHVRCVTVSSISGEARKNLEGGSWVNSLPGDESQTGQQHAIKAVLFQRRLGRRAARPAQYGESYTAQSLISNRCKSSPTATTPKSSVALCSDSKARHYNFHRVR